MDRQIFKMNCDKLATEIRCEENINAKGFLTPLWEAFSYITDKRFSEACEHIKETWHWRKFPLIADFNDALNATKRDEYKPVKRNDKIEPYGAYAAYINKIFRAMDRIRTEVCGKEENTAETFSKLKKFYREKSSQNLVLSLQTNQWVDRDKCSFENYDPAGW